MSRDLFDLMGGDEARAPFNGELLAQHDMIEFEMVLHYQTPDAVHVSLTGEDIDAEWLPKTHIKINRDGRQIPAVKKDGQRTILPVITVLVPKWLAKIKGLA